MCFTIEIHLTRKAIEERFTVDAAALYDFDFNYFYRAFNNPFIPVVTQDERSAVKLVQWGLIPGWTGNREKAEQIRRGTYNARSESLHEKPAFREALNRGRCLVVAHGFYEWQLDNGRKIPWYIRLKENAAFAFAGLYDTWTDPDSGEQLETCSIITTSANPMMEKIHNTKKRMPVILPQQHEEKWITGKIPHEQIQQLLVPFDESELKAHTVGPMLSRPDADPSDPEIIAPYTYPVPGMLF